MLYMRQTSIKHEIVIIRQKRQKNKEKETRENPVLSIQCYDNLN